MKDWTALLLIACAGLAPGRDIVVIAHRGEHLHHTENTLPAFQAAIDAGADFFECDVRTTSDGRLVLMHDASVDRTTNGKGKISDLTFDQVRSLRAGASSIPTFEEALRLAKGHIGVYVDYKEAAPDAIVAAIDGAEMGEHVVIYGDPDPLRQIHLSRSAWKVMPEAENPARLRELIALLHLRVAAFDSSDFRPDTIEVARTAGLDIYLDCLGPKDNERGWSEALDGGATGIQTDHPAELVAFLRSKGLHK
jgi:glycerophosphoryl diester phosphodiesterase